MTANPGRSSMHLFLRIIFFALLLAGLLAPVRAAVVHKWIDANGVTHYSDKAPPEVQTPVTRIDLPPSAKADSNNDYHSITNQWARMHRERLERERIELEQARLRAEQQPVKAEVVYVERPDTGTSFVGVYPVYRYLRHGHHYRPPYKHGYKHPRRKQRVGHGVTRSERHHLGFYKHVQ